MTDPIGGSVCTEPLCLCASPECPGSAAPIAPLVCPSNWLEIELAIYRCVVVVTWEPSLAVIMARGRTGGVQDFGPEWTKAITEAMESTCMGYCTSFGADNPDVLVWLRHKPETLDTWGVLYHELYHAVDHVAEDHGLEGEREARAYVFEYLARTINRRLAEAE